MDLLFLGCLGTISGHRTPCIVYYSGLGYFLRRLGEFGVFVFNFAVFIFLKFLMTQVSCLTLPNSSSLQPVQLLQDPPTPSALTAPCSLNHFGKC